MTTETEITYSYGQLQNQANRPTVVGPELWHIHYYIQPNHRTTWDISNQQVIACYAEAWQRNRRGHMGWCHVRDEAYSAPITLSPPDTSP